MQALRLAIELIKGYEGCSLTVYRCPAGIPTIGWGTVVASMSQPPITQAQADVWLAREAERAMLSALKLAPELGAFPERLAAVTSFIYNLGSGRFRNSTLRRRIRARRWEEAAAEFAKWVYGGGRKLPGLVKRRAAEAALFLSAKSPRGT